MDITKKLTKQSITSNIEYKTIDNSFEAVFKMMRDFFAEENGTFVLWTINEVLWGWIKGGQLQLLDRIKTFEGEAIELRAFNNKREARIIWCDNSVNVRLVDDTNGPEVWYVDSISPILGDKVSSSDDMIELIDSKRKISLHIPYADANVSKYGLTTRAYIGFDENSGLAGYTDYRFVSIEEV